MGEKISFLDNEGMKKLSELFESQKTVEEITDIILEHHTKLFELRHLVMRTTIASMKHRDNKEVIDKINKVRHNLHRRIYDIRTERP